MHTHTHTHTHTLITPPPTRYVKYQYGEHLYETTICDHEPLYLPGLWRPETRYLGVVRQ